MSIGYQIYDKAGSYYLTFQVLDGVDLHGWLAGNYTRNRYCRYVMDVMLRIQIKNLASLRRRRSLRIAGDKTYGNGN